MGGGVGGKKGRGEGEGREGGEVLRVDKRVLPCSDCGIVILLA